MSYAEVVTALSVYILSLAAAIVLAIAAKKISSKIKSAFIALHFLLLIVFIALYIAEMQYNYAFLIFFCSGILCAGLILRSAAGNLPKIYFSLYILSVVYFMISPSGMVNILTLREPTTDNRKFQLAGDYYLEEEKQLISTKENDVTYKVIQQAGSFHKTLVRHISFGHRVDSIRTITFKTGELANIRGYFNVKSPTFETDSVDISFQLTATSDKIIQKRKK